MCEGLVKSEEAVKSNTIKNYKQQGERLNGWTAKRLLISKNKLTRSRGLILAGEAGEGGGT